MVRFVVTIELEPDAEEAMAAASIDLPTVWEGLAGIDTPGLVSFHAGRDVGTHLDDNWSFAVVIDFVDLASFRAWFDHPDHARIGGPMEPYIAQTCRVVYDLDHAVSATRP